MHPILFVYQIRQSNYIARIELAFQCILHALVQYLLFINDLTTAATGVS